MITREEWLLSCIQELKPFFQRVGHAIPDKVRASCSWPSKGALSKKKRLGEAWSAELSGDQHFETFISPVLQEPDDVMATLVHELVHCVVGVRNKHNKAFRACAKRVGLVGKATATTAGPELTDRLHTIFDKIGPYPHAELHYFNAPPKQSTRMLVVKCPQCDYQVRTTRKWLEIGIPTCCCGALMEHVADD